jgi:hypothetical protein
LSGTSPRSSEPVDEVGRLRRAADLPLRPIAASARAASARTSSSVSSISSGSSVWRCTVFQF